MLKNLSRRLALLTGLYLALLASACTTSTENRGTWLNQCRAMGPSGQCDQGLVCYGGYCYRLKDLADGGPAEDGGLAEDGGPAADGGPIEDGGLAVDGGPAEDGGPVEDGGPTEDGGPVEDGGPAADGGPAEDGGPTEDGGVSLDGGMTEPNTLPSWTRAPHDVTVELNEAFDQAVAQAADNDQPNGAPGQPGHLDCALEDSTCSFALTVGGFGQGAVTCNLSFNAPSIEELCTVKLKVVDGYGGRIHKKFLIDVKTRLRVYFVDKRATSGNQNGESWQDAYTTVQTAVDAVSTGSWIWVAQGTYSATGNPMLTMKDGIALFGGFSGDETTLGGRGNPADHPTVLDGQNGRRVVVGANNARLDGFQIKQGRSPDGGYGGGLENNGVDNMVVSNCHFSRNVSSRGGAIYNYQYAPLITNCYFEYNYNSGSPSYGGAIHNYQSSPIILRSTFVENSSTQGGAISNNNSSPWISESSFTKNIANSYGGAMYNHNASHPTIMNSTFTENGSNNTGGALFNTNSNPLISGCLFKKNHARSGGAMILENASPTIIGSTFISNQAAQFGGVMQIISNSHPLIQASSFISNWSGTNGGALDITSSSPSFYNCLFQNNRSQRGGTAYITGLSALPTFTHCDFVGNLALFYGGALFITSNASATVSNSILWGNLAVMSDDQIKNDSVGLSLHHSTVQGGFAGGDSTYNEDPLFTHTPLFWDFTTNNGILDSIEVTDATRYPVDEVIEIDNDGVPRKVTQASGTTVSFTPELGLSSKKDRLVALWGLNIANIEEDLRLKSNSPAIGRALAQESLDCDHDGNRRPSGSVGDLGAFEFQEGDAYGHTITIDGAKDFMPVETLRTSKSDHQAYVAWDSQYLYLGMEGPEIAAGNSNKWLLIYLGGTQGTGTRTGWVYGNLKPRLPFAARYHIGWMTSAPTPEAKVFNGAAWNAAGWNWADNVKRDNDFIEMRIPLSQLGSPALLKLHLNMIDMTTGSESSWASVPWESFRLPRGSNYERYLEFQLNGKMVPLSYPALP